jgi:hypothetical protein
MDHNAWTSQAMNLSRSSAFHLLSVPHATSVNESHKQCLSSKTDVTDTYDVIDAGILPLMEAKRLFVCFFDYFNPQTTVLDPDLHTFTYVRETSKALFHTMLAIASTHNAFPVEGDQSATIAPTLPAIAEAGIWQAIRTSDFTLENIQAMLLGFLFPLHEGHAHPENTWVFITCAMHGVNLLRIDLSRMSESVEDTEGDTTSEIRNPERTWLNTVLLERTHSTFVEGVSSHLLDKIDWKALRRWSEEKGALSGDVALAGYLHMRHLEVRHPLIE